MQKQYTRVAVNVFVVRDGQLLLGKRKTTGDGSWGLPGGHVEYMESLVDAAARELAEETGLVANELVFNNFVNEPDQENGTHYVHVNFVAKGFSGEPQLMEPDKCYEWQWFELDNLPENIFHGHRLCVPAFLEHSPFNDYGSK